MFITVRYTWFGQSCLYCFQHATYITYNWYGQHFNLGYYHRNTMTNNSFASWHYESICHFNIEIQSYLTIFFFAQMYLCWNPKVVDRWCIYMDVQCGTRPQGLMPFCILFHWVAPLYVYGPILNEVLGHKRVHYWLQRELCFLGYEWFCVTFRTRWRT